MSQPRFGNSNQPKRSRRTRSQSGGRVVLPTDKIQEGEEKHRLRSGSKWRQCDLALLRVKFEPHEDSELTMLDVEHEWSPSRRQRILLIPPGLLIACRSRFISWTAYGHYPRDVEGIGLRWKYWKNVHRHLNYFSAIWDLFSAITWGLARSRIISESISWKHFVQYYLLHLQDKEASKFPHNYNFGSRKSTSNKLRLWQCPAYPRTPHHTKEPSV